MIDPDSERCFLGLIVGALGGIGLMLFAIIAATYLGWLG
jgi:hypothetical protein